MYSGPILHFLRGLFALVPSVVLANGTYTCIGRQLDSEVLHVRRSRLQVRALCLKAELFFGKVAKRELRRLNVVVPYHGVAWPVVWPAAAERRAVVPRVYSNARHSTPNNLRLPFQQAWPTWTHMYNRPPLEFDEFR